MKIAVISDIHIDINSEAHIDDLLGKWFQEKGAADGAEGLIIAGDITEDARTSIDYVERLEQEIGYPVYYVPGNHDLWNRNGTYSSNDEIYRMFEADPHCLSGKTAEFGSYLLAGDVGWYDYSFANQISFSEDEFNNMTCNGRTWQDKLYNDWTGENRARNTYFIDKFQKVIDDNWDKKICFVTHMINHEAFSIPDITNNFYFFNAYIGSRKLQTMLEKSSNVTHCICGHIHFRKDFYESGKKWLCRCLGYEREWPLFSSSEEDHIHDNDALWQIDNAVEIIDL